MVFYFSFLRVIIKIIKLWEQKIMKIAVVDDNKKEQESLSAAIKRNIESSDTVIELFDSGEEFSCVVKDKTYDAVFMDIIMEGQNGIEAARSLREITLDTLLIFVTSSPEYMAQAFPCHAFDYIIKPYTEQRMKEVLDDVKRAVDRNRRTVEIGKERFLLNDILYVYSNSNYCEIHTKHGTRRIRIPFSELSEQLLHYSCFWVINRGTAINFDNTSHISRLDCVMINGDRLSASRRKIKEIEKAFLSRQFNKLLEGGN